MNAQPMFCRVAGAPIAPGTHVRVTGEIDADASQHGAHIGSTGVVVYLEYLCGCGQQYPRDPMIGVRLWGDSVREFWAAELTTLPMVTP